MNSIINPDLSFTGLGHLGNKIKVEKTNLKFGSKGFHSCRPILWKRLSCNIIPAVNTKTFKNLTGNILFQCCLYVI